MLLKEKASTTYSALQIIIEKEIEIDAAKRKKAIILILLLSVLFITTIIILVWHKSGKDRTHEGIVDAENLNAIEEQHILDIEEVKEMVEKNDQSFLSRFQEVFPTFYAKMIALSDDLTPTDLSICAMTYLNFSTSEIAEYTFVEFRTVQTRRSRFRKKIDLDPEIDLFTYLHLLDNDD